MVTAVVRKRRGMIGARSMWRKIQMRFVMRISSSTLSTYLSGDKNGRTAYGLFACCAGVVVGIG